MRTILLVPFLLLAGLVNAQSFRLEVSKGSIDITQGKSFAHCKDDRATYTCELKDDSFNPPANPDDFEFAYQVMHHGSTIVAKEFKRNNDELTVTFLDAGWYDIEIWAIKVADSSLIGNISFEVVVSPGFTVENTKVDATENFVCASNEIRLTADITPNTVSYNGKSITAAIETGPEWKHPQDRNSPYQNGQKLVNPPKTIGNLEYTLTLIDTFGCQGAENKLTVKGFEPKLGVEKNVQLDKDNSAPIYASYNDSTDISMTALKPTISWHLLYNSSMYKDTLLTDTLESILNQDTYSHTFTDPTANAGEYHWIVAMDVDFGNGCIRTAYDSVQILEHLFNNEEVANIFNADMEEFRVAEDLTLSVKEFEPAIYDRSGRKVCCGKKYESIEDFSWNGKINNKGFDLPAGYYFYVFKVLGYGTGTSKYTYKKGTVYLHRNQ